MAISTRFLLLLSFLYCLSQTACAATGTATCGNEPMYQNGPFSVANVSVDKGGAGPHCCSLWVVFPEDAGPYPVVQFQHGYELQNADYKGLLLQMYEGIATDVTTEITNAISILNWRKTGLIAWLPSAYAKHEPDFDKVALAGHSCGGHVVFGLALKLRNALLNYSAIVGLDPVDGTRWLSPPILTHEENSMDVGVPTLIVGTAPSACAPEYLRHINFYKDLKPASFHFVAPKNGHMDFTDHITAWPACKDGPSRQCMHQFSAGITVAFLQDVLFHNNTSFSAALNQTAKAPVDLDPPQWKGTISSTSEALHEYADIR